MPYKDKDKRRAVQRESQRKRRDGSTPRQPLPALEELRLDTAKDVITLLKGELQRFTHETALDPGERLRGVVGACGTLLRAFEQADLVERLEALESRMGEPTPGLRAVGG